ncbi:GM14799 [Drosophila sechellia]|uniref:GM14799 n=1 Tax=Drosophila sechellia TaxID=7238 RepID=B4HUY2_DROSE|nr:GM14799 [Drosophila sechellia]
MGDEESNSDCSSNLSFNNHDAVGVSVRAEECKSQASFIELFVELKPEDLPDELLMLLIVPVDNYTTNESWLRGGVGWRGGHSGLMERSLANFMGLRQQAIGYQFA